LIERFIDDTLEEKGVLWLRVHWFGCGSEEDTRKHSGRLPVAAVYRYCRRKGLLPQDQDMAEQGIDPYEA